MMFRWLLIFLCFGNTELFVGVYDNFLKHFWRAVPLLGLRWRRR